MDNVVQLEDLKEIVSRLQSENKKVVFTNGCFDLLHVGHIRYLRKARGLGDVLVVALNSDLSVKAIKPGRPVINEQERAEVLASLDMVDYVTLFEEETPYRVISELRPDVLVKGGDWSVKDIVGADIVAEVYSLPYINGASTTEIIERIKSI